MTAAPLLCVALLQLPPQSMRLRLQSTPGGLALAALRFARAWLGVQPKRLRASAHLAAQARLYGAQCPERPAKSSAHADGSPLTSESTTRKR